MSLVGMPRMIDLFPFGLPEESAEYRYALTETNV